MRNESIIYGLFSDIAEKDDRILAVYLNGSRTNKNVPRDIFQDYDVVFVVTETASFIKDENWPGKFGRILYMQRPDEHPDYPSDKANFYGWLMQFDDGVRIDLHVESAAHAKAHIFDDKLCVILFDKKGILPQIPEAADEDYHVKKPTETQFRACVNEFWWCTNNLAKGLWRGEMPYVQDMANFVVRKELERMLSWKVGVKTDFRVSVGKSAKYLYQWLTAADYQHYLSTYFDGNIENAWNAVISMCDLFEAVTDDNAKELGYSFDRYEPKAARQFLLHVRELPRNAKEIF